MATKNKKDSVTDLNANIFTNTQQLVTAAGVRVPFTDILNSVAFNVLVAQLQAEDSSAFPTTAYILDPGLQGVFIYDPNDLTSTDDGGASCIVTSVNQRYKRRVANAIDARWYGQANYYFNQVSDAVAAIKSWTRFIGLEVAILNNGNLSTYWFLGGVADANLVLKIRETMTIDFTVGDGGANTPADGTSIVTNPLLFNAIILGFWMSGRKTRTVNTPAVLSTSDVYGVFDPANSKITLQNGGLFTANSDYSIMYK